MNKAEFKDLHKCFNAHYEDFYVYAESKGIEITQIDDFFEWYENLLSLEENLEHLKGQIEARYEE